MSKKFFIDFNTVNWKYINWSVTRRYVSRLQRRIYTAAFRQEYGKMKQIQKRLLFSSYSKLLSVFIVIQYSTASLTMTEHDKLSIAKYLTLDQSAYYIYLRNFMCIGIKKQRQKLLYCVIKQARQFLAELVFKPEWSAKCTRNLYIITIGYYGEKRKIAKLLRGLYKTPNAYTLVLDLAMYVVYGNYLGLVNKLPGPNTMFLRSEVKVWLQKENLLAFKTRKFAYNNLSNYTMIRDSTLPVKIVISLFINELSSWLLRKKLSTSLQYFVHNSQLIFVCKNQQMRQSLIFFVKTWFIAIKTDLRLVQLSLGSAQNGFEFAGYRLQKNSQYIAVTISKKSQVLIWRELNKVIQRSKSISSYLLIQKLSHKIAFWGNYFCYTKCSKVFSLLDYLLHLRILIWALRRHPMASKDYIKLKYFPQSKQYIYRKRLVRSNWILYGEANTAKIKKCFLLKFLWLKHLITY